MKTIFFLLLSTCSFGQQTFELGTPTNYKQVYDGRAAGKFTSGWQLFNVNASGRPNVVGNLYMYNATNNGGRIDNTEAAFRFGMETHYEMNGGNPFFEFHLPEVTDYNGGVYRPLSLYVRKANGGTDYNFSAVTTFTAQTPQKEDLFGFDFSGNYYFIGRAGGAQLGLFRENNRGHYYKVMVNTDGSVYHRSNWINDFNQRIRIGASQPLFWLHNTDSNLGWQFHVDGSNDLHIRTAGERTKIKISQAGVITFVGLKAGVLMVNDNGELYSK